MSQTTAATAATDNLDDNWDIVKEIDKFLEGYTSDGTEFPVNINNINSLDDCDLQKELNTADLVFENKSLFEQNDVEFVGKQSAVFELLEDDENFGVYEHNPNESNWNVFYKTLPPDEQKFIVKQEPGTEISNDYSVTDDVNKSHGFENSQMSNIKLEQLFTETIPQIEVNMVPNINSNEELSTSSTTSYDIQNSESEFEKFSFSFDNDIFQNTSHDEQINTNQEPEIEIIGNTNESHLHSQINHEFLETHNNYENYKTNQEIVESSEIGRWKPPPKQHIYPDSGRILPPYRNRNYQNNYGQSNRWRQRDSYTTLPRNNDSQNDFRKIYHSKPQESSLLLHVPPNGVTNSKLSPVNKPRGYNSLSNKVFFKDFKKLPYNIQGKNQFDSRVAFIRNNDKLKNMHCGMNNSKSFITNSKPKQTNIEHTSFNNFKQPFLPSVSINKSTNYLTEDFEKNRNSINQPILSKQILNKPHNNDAKWHEHNKNSVWRHSDSFILPTRPDDSFFHSSNVDLKSKRGNQFTNKTISQMTTEMCDSRKRTESFDTALTSNNRELSQLENRSKKYATSFPNNKKLYFDESGLKFNNVEFLKETEEITIVSQENNKNTIIDINENCRNDKIINSYDISSMKKARLSQCEHYIIKDYLSPVSLVGSTIKFTSRKLANTSVRDQIVIALNTHGTLENSWWTPDDMFFATYTSRSIAQQVIQIYPKNTSNSY